MNRGVKMREKIEFGEWIDATILFADIIGFSKCSEIEQMNIYHVLFTTIIDEISTFHEGRDYILKSTGDGFLL